MAMRKVVSWKGLRSVSWAGLRKIREGGLPKLWPASPGSSAAPQKGQRAVSRGLCRAPSCSLAEEAPIQCWQTFAKGITFKRLLLWKLKYFLNIHLYFLSTPGSFVGKMYGCWCVGWQVTGSSLSLLSMGPCRKGSAQSCSSPQGASARWCSWLALSCLSKDNMSLLLARQTLPLS